MIWLKNIRFEVRTRERNHIGRPHCHVVVRDCDASIDLISFEVLESNGYTKKEVDEIVKTVKKFSNELIAKWEEYHGKKEN